MNDNDSKAFEDAALLEWARNAPESHDPYSGPQTEDQAAFRDHERKEWMKKKPRVRNPYGDGR